MDSELICKVPKFFVQIARYLDSIAETNKLYKVKVLLNKTTVIECSLTRKGAIKNQSQFIFATYFKEGFPSYYGFQSTVIYGCNYWDQILSGVAELEWYNEDNLYRYKPTVPDVEILSPCLHHWSPSLFKGDCLSFIDVICKEGQRTQVFLYCDEYVIFHLELFKPYVVCDGEDVIDTPHPIHKKITTGVENIVLFDNPQNKKTG